MSETNTPESAEAPAINQHIIDALDTSKVELLQELALLVQADLAQVGLVYGASSLSIEGDKLNLEIYYRHTATEETLHQAHLEWSKAAILAELAPFHELLTRKLIEAVGPPPKPLEE